jgi:hypothetical protein
MARLQVLYLPSVVDGDDVEPRYGFVVDQAADLDPADRDVLSAFAVSVGGQGCVVVSGVLDIAQGDDDEETTQALGELLTEALRATAFDQPAAPQPVKLAPANTTEGKLQRVLGGQKILDQMREADPQS